MGISFDAPAKHPSMFVGQEFMQAHKVQVPVCPKCANRLAVGRNEELVCVIHGPINKMNNNVRGTPDIPLKMRALTPAPVCSNVIPSSGKKCGASVMFLEDKWYCESCEKREKIERKQAEMKKEADALKEESKDTSGIKEESRTEVREGLSGTDATSSLKVKDDLHDGSKKEKKK